MGQQLARDKHKKHYQTDEPPTAKTGHGRKISTSQEAPLLPTQRNPREALPALPQRSYIEARHPYNPLYPPPSPRSHSQEPNPLPNGDLGEENDIYVALFDFTARVGREMSFREDDKLRIVNSEGDDWLYAVKLHDKSSGLIPSNFVAPINSLEAKKWFFGELSRRTAESLLRRRVPGTFLVRTSKSKPGAYVLSIKDAPDDRGLEIKHYVIKYSDGKYSIFNRSKFQCIDDLLQEYIAKPRGLTIALVTPCAKMAPQIFDLSCETKDVWEINREEVEFYEEIGHGNFGSVWRGMWRGKIEVAIKTLKSGKMSPENFLEEAIIMKGLRHMNIVTLLAVCSKEEPILIITEFVKLGSLLSLLQNEKEKQSISEDQMLNYAHQIAKGMEYLEQKKLVHRDLAARNVLVNEVPILKIADFGLAKIAEEDVNICRSKFPVKWSPPETILRGEFSIKSDVWAFGIVVMEIFIYGDSVYPNMTIKEVQLNVKNGYRHPCPILMPERIYDVLKKCWSHHPEERPTFEDLVEFFDESTHKIVDGTQYLTETDFKAAQ